MHCRPIGAFAAAECHRTVGYGAVPSGKIESDPQKCYCQLIESSKFLRKCQTSSSRILAIPFGLPLALDALSRAARVRGHGT
jgi:hypothetical protein